MIEDDDLLRGKVEIDETSVDGKPRKPNGPQKGQSRRSEGAKLRERSRATVFAAVEREGRVKATVLPSRRGPALKEQAIQWIEPETIVYTDEWPAYNKLGDHFSEHNRISHSSGYYVDGDIYTNTIEGFFGNLKPSIRGTYKKVSHKWLQGYLNEFTWRYNHRHDPKAMFETLLLRATSR